MTNLGIKLNNIEYKNQISEIIQKELTDLHSANGYKSIIETMIKVGGKPEKEIITNYELFVELIESIFRRLDNSKRYCEVIGT